MKYICTICFEIYGKKGICGACNSEAMMFDVVNLNLFLLMNKISTLRILIAQYKKDKKLRDDYKTRVIKNIKCLINLKRGEIKMTRTIKNTGRTQREIDSKVIAKNLGAERITKENALHILKDKGDRINCAKDDMMRRAIIRIIKITDNKDGTSTLDIEFGDGLKRALRKHYKRKNITQSLIQKAMLEGMTNYVNKTLSRGKRFSLKEITNEINIARKIRKVKRGTR